MPAALTTSASFPSCGAGGDHVAAAPSYIPLSSLLGAFAGAGDEARRRAAQRPLGLARRAGRAWLVHPDARLPGGLQALAWLRCGPPAPTLAGFPLPPGHEAWTDRDRRRFLDSHELIRRYDECRRETRTAAEALALLAARHGDWARARGLPLSQRSLCRIRRRLDPASDDFDGNVDGRGRSRAAGGDSGRPRATIDPAAWDHFRALWLTPQRRSVKLCWEITAVEAARRGWAWPSLRTVQARVRAELPPFVADRHRLGEQAWSRKYAPRIQRDLSTVRPNQVWVGDHAQFDFLALGEAGQPVRLWLTAWLDQRSRMLVGHHISAAPDSDTILAAFRAGVLDYGAPERVIIDNGKDYRAAALSGGRRGRPRLDEQRARSVFGRLDVAVTFCEPFNPGAKAIERFFSTMHDRFDRLFDSYCGRDPAHRPEDLYARLRRRRVALPTLAEVRARFADWVAAYHLQPHRGDGMDGLCPADAFARDPIPRRTAPRALLDLLLRKTVEVRVTRHGVRHQGVHYGQANPELWRRRGQTVLLRLDPDRADRVEVLDLAGRHITWATEQRLTGLGQDDIKQLRRRQKRARRIAAEALPALRDAGKSIVEHAVAAQAARGRMIRQAAGGEHEPADPRGVRLLPVAGLGDPPPALPAASNPLDAAPDCAGRTVADAAPPALDLVAAPPAAGDDAPPDPLDAQPPLRLTAEDTDSPLDAIALAPAEPGADADPLDDLPPPEAAGPGERLDPLDRWDDDDDTR